MVRDLLDRLSGRLRDLIARRRGGQHVLDWSRRGRELVLVDIPARSRALVRRVPEPVQIRLHRLSRRSLSVTFEVFAGLFVLGAVALGVAYERLNRGPVSVAFLVPAIENAINRELSGIVVKIDDAILQKTDAGAGVNFRLRNIRLTDRDDAVVAQAPYAGIGLSGSALLWGRIAPGSVDFIGPRLLLFYTPDQGLSLTFSRQAEDAAPEPATRAPGGTVPDGGARAQPAAGVGVEQQIDLMKAVTGAFERARGGNAASSYLRRFGVRNALVVFDRNGETSVWQVPDFAIDMEHGSSRSVIEGEARISSSTGPWTFQFRTEQSRKDDRLTFTALVRDLVPLGLAENFPSIRALQSVDMPVSARTRVHFSASGEFLGADARFGIAAGRIVAPWDPDYPIGLDEGDLRVRYSAADGRFEIQPSTLRWGGSRMTVSGEFRPTEPEGALRRWSFALRADDAVLMAEEFGLPAMKVDQWIAEGTVTPDAGRIVLEQFLIRAGNAEVELAGTVIDAPGSPAVRLRGRISPMPVSTLVRFWPKFIAAGARGWVGERVTAGFVSGGDLNIDIPAGLLAQLEMGGDVPEQALAFDVDVTGLEMHYIENMPPVQTGDARIRIRGRTFGMTVPQAWVALPSGQKIALSDGRFTIDDLRQDPSQGVIAFRSASSATAALELLDHEPLGFVRASGRRPGDVSGRADGAFELAMPIMRGLEFNQVRLQGSVRLDEAVVTGGFGKNNIQGGSIVFTVTEQSLQATGDVLVNGVAGKLSWQRLFAAPNDKQPEMRLSLVLDEAARDKLGIKVNHMLRGPVPAVVSLGQSAAGPAPMHVQADLGNAELVLANVGWRKPPGVAATLRFDVVDTGQGTSELRDYKIVGDSIAIDGWIALDAAGEPSAFYFSDFSFNIITHLEIAGKKRPDKVWEVRANGSSYDGRQFFQSLFSAGQLSADLPAADVGSDIDLTARMGAMVGYFDTTVQDVSVTLKKRGGLLRELDARGTLQSGAPVAVRLQSGPGQPRVLVGESRDAGSAFRLIGFYPRVQGGEASLQVNLDGEGAASKTGILWARDFVILGDRVVGEVVSTAGDDPMHALREPGRRRSTAERQRIVFNQLRAPFSVGGGQFVLHDSYINGPLLGATLRGNVDFLNQRVDLGGTYIPLYGLNSALGSIPIIGNILVGRRGEGVLGITFAIQGPTSDPDVLVNPVSMVAPGIFRQIFEFTGNRAETSALPEGLPGQPQQQPARRRPAPVN